MPLCKVAEATLIAGNPWQQVVCRSVRPCGIAGLAGAAGAPDGKGPEGLWRVAHARTDVIRDVTAGAVAVRGAAPLVAVGGGRRGDRAPLHTVSYHAARGALFPSPKKGCRLGALGSALQPWSTTAA